MSTVRFGDRLARLLSGRRIQTRTATITHADLTSAVNGNPEIENIGALLPAGARIVGMDVLLTTQFTGGAVAAVTMDVGLAADPTALMATFNALGSAAPASYALGGAAATRPRGDFGGLQLIATFTPDGANHLEDLTAGEVTITVDFYLPDEG